MIQIGGDIDRLAIAAQSEKSVHNALTSSSGNEVVKIQSRKEEGHVGGLTSHEASTASDFFGWIKDL